MLQSYHAQLDLGALTQHGSVPLSLPNAQLGRAVSNKIKQCRRIATRYDELAANYLAFIKLADSDLARCL